MRLFMRDYSEKSSSSELDFAKKMTYGFIFDRNFYFCIEKISQSQNFYTNHANTVFEPE